MPYHQAACGTHANIHILRRPPDPCIVRSTHKYVVWKISEETPSTQSRRLAFFRYGFCFLRVKTQEGIQFHACKGEKGLEHHSPSKGVSDLHLAFFPPDGPHFSVSEWLREYSPLNERGLHSFVTACMIVTLFVPTVSSFLLYAYCCITEKDPSMKDGQGTV